MFPDRRAGQPARSGPDLPFLSSRNFSGKRIHCAPSSCSAALAPASRLSDLNLGARAQAVLALSKLDPVHFEAWVFAGPSPAS